MRQLSKLDYRIPDWDTKSLIDRTCPICNNIGKPILRRPDKLLVNICNNCDSYYISPAPEKKSLIEFYSTYFDNHSIMPKVSCEQLKQHYDKINPFADIRVRKLSSIFKIENSNVLDIGFGQPYLLYLFKKLGAQTHGLDIDPKAIEYANYLKIHSVFKGDFSEYFPQIKFDLIIMTDFVEHPLFPIEFIEKAISLLKPSGILLIWTPNGDSEINNEEPITFRVDLEHMQYFTSGTIVYLANKLNLRIIHLELLGQPALGNFENTDCHETEHTRTGFISKIKESIKRNIRKYVLKESFETNFLPVEVGNYHLYALLAKSQILS